MTTTNSSNPTPREDMTASAILRLRQGDPRAGALLEELYRAKMIGFCFGYLGDHDQAEDAVQDIFCIVQNVKVVPDRFRAWIYCIARSRCLRILRSRNVTHRRAGALPAESNLPDDATSILSSLIRAERHERLRQLIAAMTPEQRELYRLKYEEGLRRKEIAEILGLPESTVKSRLEELKKMLREHSSLGP